jgi:hypothetical protein
MVSSSWLLFSDLFRQLVYLFTSTSGYLHALLQAFISLLATHFLTHADADAQGATPHHFSDVEPSMYIDFWS